MLKIIQHAGKAVDQAEVYWLRQDFTNCSFSNGRLNHVNQGTRSAAAVRVIADDRMGSSFGESPDQLSLLHDAADAAQFGTRVRYGFASDQPSVDADAFDQHIKNLRIEELVDVCLGIGDHIQRVAPDAEPNIMCAAETRSLRIAATENVDVQEESTRLAVRVIIPFADRGTDIGAYGLALNHSWETPSEDWIEALVEQRDLGTKASRPPSAKLPVLLSPQVANLLLLPLSAGLEGHALSEGTSPLCGKMGMRILSDKLTIREDPTHGGLFHPRSFDDEGISCQSRVLVDAGALCGSVIDLRSGEKLGIESTGNAVRRTLFTGNIDDAPIPSLLGAVVEPGTISYGDLISGIDNGLLVTFVRGLHSCNFAQGDFTVQADGFHIVKGKIAGYLSKTMLSGNIYETFQSIRALSRETEATAQGPLNIAGSSPFLLLDSVQVTAS